MFKPIKAISLRKASLSSVSRGSSGTSDINKEEEENSARQALVRYGKAFEKKGFRKFKNSSNKADYNKNYSKSSAKVEMMMCGHCFRAQKPHTVYSTHNIDSCNFLSKDQKMRLLGSMARAIDAEDHSSGTENEDNLEDITTEDPDIGL